MAFQMWLLDAVLAIAALALAWQFLALRRAVRDLADAAEARQPLLAANDRSLGSSEHLPRLRGALNALLDERAQGTRQEAGYLAQIEATLGNIKEAVLILDAEQRVAMANPAAVDLFGRDKVAAGARVESFVRGAGLLDHIYRIVRGENRPRGEFPLPLGRDEPRWIELSGAPVAAPGPDGRPLYLFVLHDITRLKNLESVRKEFVANVSHELRTPITIVKGFADTLLEDDATLSPEDRRRFLAKIQRNIQRLAALVDDLLTLSRLESEQAGLDRRTHSLRSLVEDIAAEYADRFRDAGVQLEMDLRHENDRLIFDPLRLSQVFHNLLDNCFRYAKGFTHVRILTRQEDGVVRVTVEDDGCGIPAADVPHVFERFYRVDKGRSRESGGTGLGLSIVKHVVLLHGGTVACESEERTGTRIHFTLPVA